jgi:DNA repair exonuclease SbcCD ATPase subunit
MITIKQLRWANAFSYGKDNQVDFTQSPLTQLVGRNGHGKSSIALILEEVLFNKNSKGIKKADILNRYVKDKSYNIELDFNRDGIDYTIKSTRGSAQTVKLFKNGNDISAHTATATYKMIEEILGFDHKSFAQIVYQSNASSLEFLTAPDTARKKFLIEILNLSKYTRAAEIFKEVTTELSKDIATASSKVSTVNSWLNKYESTDLTIKPNIEVPEMDPKLYSETLTLSQQLDSLESINKKIQQNNTYKQLQSKIKLLPIPNEPKTDIQFINEKTKVLNDETIELTKTVKDSKIFIQKMEKLEGSCPTCLQHIDKNKIDELITEQVTIQKTSSIQLEKLSVAIRELNEETLKYNNEKSVWQQAQKSQEDWEKYHRLIDTELQTELLDKKQIEQTLNELETNLQQLRKEINAAESKNKEISTHNTKVELVSKQLVEMREELESYSLELHNFSERMSILNVLTKTFSTTGLVAYKIECLVKDLEEITNKYLVDLSDGRFQISFKVNSSDKLNVVITDNGKDIEILALSGGEKARVNVATLLAIRKLMQTLSSSRINLLILDETVETLDTDGKEKLVEVLLREEHLNTFLVSHGFTHPLLEKVNVVKRNNISQIEV